MHTNVQWGWQYDYAFQGWDSPEWMQSLDGTSCGGIDSDSWNNWPGWNSYDNWSMSEPANADTQQPAELETLMMHVGPQSHCQMPTYMK